MTTQLSADSMSIDLRLAAIISLLSSSALYGGTPAKTAALRAHLESAAFAPGPLPEQLRTVLEDTLAAWLSIECHQDSVPVNFCVLASADIQLH